MTSLLIHSKGGFSCKVHALTAALGLPVRFIITPGQAADIKKAISLMENVSTEALLADKGYDSDHLVQWLAERNIQAVIPPKANRREPRDGNWWLYPFLLKVWVGGKRAKPLCPRVP